MLTVIRNGDILQSRCPALVNPVNCVGVMGKGLAKQFRNRYPDMDRQYRQDCNSRLLQPGTIRAYPVSPNRTVICLPTKRHWREPSRLQDVAAGLDALADGWSIAGSPALPNRRWAPVWAAYSGLRSDPSSSVSPTGSRSRPPSFTNPTTAAGISRQTPRAVPASPV